MADTRVADIVLRRQAPCFAVLSDDLAILSAEPRFLSVCAMSGYAAAAPDRLPEALEARLRELLSRSAAGGVTLLGSLVVRAAPLDGLAGRGVAISLERAASRAPLQSAAQRFGLTPRESAVLELILQGLPSKEIAKQLQIAQSTVGEYFKHLSCKIESRNRAEMIARVLDWAE